MGARLPQAQEREHVLELIAQLEAHNSLLKPAYNLHRVAGAWRLLFSTITILVRPLWPKTLHCPNLQLFEGFVSETERLKRQEAEQAGAAQC